MHDVETAAPDSLDDLVDTITMRLDVLNDEIEKLERVRGILLSNPGPDWPTDET